jgi:hypothetical protein
LFNPHHLYRCGDTNADGSVNIGNVVYPTNYIFHNGLPPKETCCP